MATITAAAPTAVHSIGTNTLPIALSTSSATALSEGVVVDTPMTSVNHHSTHNQPSSSSLSLNGTNSTSPSGGTGIGLVVPSHQQQHQQEQDAATMLSNLTTWITPISTLPLQLPIVFDHPGSGWVPLPETTSSSSKLGSKSISTESHSQQQSPAQDPPWASLIVLLPRDNAQITPRTQELLDHIIEPLSNRITEVLAASVAANVGSNPAVTGGATNEAKGKGKGKASTAESTSQWNYGGPQQPVLEIGAVLYGTRRSAALEAEKRTTSRPNEKKEKLVKAKKEEEDDDMQDFISVQDGDADEATEQDDREYEWLHDLNSRTPYSTAAIRRIKPMPSERFFTTLRSPSVAATSSRTDQSGGGTAFKEPRSAMDLIKDRIPASINIDSLLFGIDANEDGPAMGGGENAAMEEAWWDAGDAENHKMQDAGASEQQQERDGLLLAEGLVAALEVSLWSVCGG